MAKNTQKTVLIFICFSLVLFGLNLSTFAQDKAKVLEEIAGDYEYEYEGQYIIITYSVEDGILFGTQEGDPEPPSQLDPVEGKELTFETTGSDGNLYVIGFSRDDDGKITKSILAVMGMEIEGVKIKK
ncbi:hypothetical protein ACFLR7_01710 [Acidobacteriota bacterium]